MNRVGGGRGRGFKVGMYMDGDVVCVRGRGRRSAGVD